MMAVEGPDRLIHHRIEVSLIDKLRRIHSLAEHISKLELPPAVLSEASWGLAPGSAVDALVDTS